MALAISSIQRGSKVMAVATTSITIVAGTDAGFDTAVDRSKTLAIITWHDSSQDSGTPLRWSFNAGGDTLTVTREISDTSVTCNFQIVEFSDGLIAQYVEQTMTGTTSGTVVIDDVTSGYGRFIFPCGFSTTETNHVNASARWRLDSGTQASVNRMGTTGNVTANAIILDVEGATVRTIESTWTDTTATSQDETIEAVVLDRTSLYGTVDAPSAVSRAQSQWLMSLTSTTNVRFTRTGTQSSTITVTAYAVEWPTTVDVQHVSPTSPAWESSFDVSLSAVVVARTMVHHAGTLFLSAGAGKWSDATAELTTTTNLRLTRGNADGDTATFAAQTIEFPEPTAPATPINPFRMSAGTNGSPITLLNQPNVGSPLIIR